jgi:hypothetical protein
MAIHAVVAAGDRGAAQAVRGENKNFLDLGGRPLLAHVVAALQRVPEIADVWVVGNSKRLDAVLGRPDLQQQLAKPLRILEQFSNLYENAWESYRRLLPGAGPEGRDPAGPADEDTAVLYLSGDLPFATPQEISAFIRQAVARDCDYALGLVTQESMEGFLPAAPGEPGIEMAAFNLREGRFRQSNLHLVKPARLGNRHYIEEMYRNRHQKQLRDILSLAWRLLTGESGGLRVVWYFALMHVAGLADRRGLRRVADAIRRWIPMPRIERGCSDLLGTDFRFVVTEVGGCALDIDNEHDLDVSETCFERWRAAQAERAERLHGPLPIAPRAERSGS